MAQLPKQLGWICSKCRGTLKRDGPFRTQHLRSFSSSHKYAKTLATFTPTSSPELDATLNSWRESVFLPSILSSEHQRLIYKTSRRDILTTPPGVSVSVRKTVAPSVKLIENEEEEIIKLQPANRFARVNQAESLKKIVKLLEQNSSAAAWDNLIPFLEGLRTAKCAVPASFTERLARKANLQGKGRWNTILTAASMVGKTGLTLSERALTREILNGAFHRATLQEFKTVEPERTVQQVIQLLEAPGHCGSDIPSDMSRYADMRQDPVVMAVKLAFSATDVLKKHNRKDQHGIVSSDIRRLLTLDTTTNDDVENVPGFGYVISNIITTRKVSGPRGESISATCQLEDMAVLYGGLSLANKVDLQPFLSKKDSVELSVRLQRFTRQVKEKLEEIGRTVESGSQAQSEGDRKPRRSLKYFDAVQAALPKI
ncbi:hypothetical protein LTR64_004664 [Lithohypha guttulata]|uniref:uncharacterized protein n=1 Tax=Lithohypha guttulata TaxID=1690604 RepID=UPI002DE07F4B|nr:hypothetical protein LTR51_006039 [Lithohypha guttulata]